MRRHAFTLVELLVVVTIIGLLAALTFGAVHWAAEAARETRTRTTIAKLNSVVMEAWESYRSRRLPIENPNIPDRAVLNAFLWNARRDFVRIEMPDRFSDFLEPPLFLPISECKRCRDECARNYSRAVDGLRAQGLSDAQVERRINSYELSECLYMTVMMHGGNKIKWQSDERGDADGDGLREFHDAWGRPIIWLRWPAGWPGADDPPINYDPTVRPGLESMGPRPIIMSAGPDGIYDVNRGVEPDSAGGWMTYRYGQDLLWGNLDPWTLDENIPNRHIGEPVDAEAPNGDPPNGDMNHLDNLTSYDGPV